MTNKQLNFWHKCWYFIILKFIPFYEYKILSYRNDPNMIIYTTQIRNCADVYVYILQQISRSKYPVNFEASEPQSIYNLVNDRIVHIELPTYGSFKGGNETEMLDVINEILSFNSKIKVIFFNLIIPLITATATFCIQLKYVDDKTVIILTYSIIFIYAFLYLIINTYNICFPNEFGKTNEDNSIGKLFKIDSINGNIYRRSNGNQVITLIIHWLYYLTGKYTIPPIYKNIQN